jgi:hypothetical protein
MVDTVTLENKIKFLPVSLQSVSAGTRLAVPASGCIWESGVNSEPHCRGILCHIQCVCHIFTGSYASGKIRKDPESVLKFQYLCVQRVRDIHIS